MSESIDREIRIAFLVSLVVVIIKIAAAKFFFDVSADPPTLITLLVIVAVTALVARFGNRKLTFGWAAFAVFKLMAFGTYFWSTMEFHIGRSFPMVDDKLARMDTKFGFDFFSYIRFMDDHNWLNLLLYPAYMSIFWQPMAIAIVLLAKNQERGVLRLMLAIGLALAVATMIAVFFPAYGAYHFFGVTPALHPHIAHLETGDGTAAALDWLRASTLIGDLPKNHGGLMSFPSLHTTAAALYIYYSRSNRLLLFASCLLNTAMLLATPLHGSHYLTDMIAGAFVAAAVVMMIELLVNGSLRRSPALAGITIAVPAIEVVNV